MKGFSLTRNFVIRLLLVLIVLAMLVGLTYTAVAEPIKRTSLTGAISILCPQWEAKGCTRDTATMSVDFEGSSTTLEDLCALDYDSSTSGFTTPGVYEHCVNECKFCPI